MTRIADLVRDLELLAPPSLAAEWDNTGLLWGDEATATDRVMTCLTVTPEVVAEAIEAKAGLIVSHHPVLFRAVKRLTTGTVEGRMLLALARAGIGIYSPHTSFDNARGGINEILANRLGLTDIQPLRAGQLAREFKIVVFVPETDLGPVSDAMFVAGAGRIGEYRECSFRLAGTGTFFGTENTNPTLGQRGQREEVPELRLEVVCAESCLAEVITAMRRTHSYEEPAFDVYPLQPRVSSLGDGRLGRLVVPSSLVALAATVKSMLQCQVVQWLGDPARLVESLAVVCGAGGELLSDAIRCGADVFLTGELRFHDMLAAESAGLALILPGHYATERIGVEALAAQLQQRWPGITVWASRSEHDPLRNT